MISELKEQLSPRASSNSSELLKFASGKPETSSITGEFLTQKQPYEITLDCLESQIQEAALQNGLLRSIQLLP